MTWQKILWKLGSPAALSYARSATGRQNRAPSVWAAFQVQVNVTLFAFFIYREWKVTITTSTKFQTPNFEHMFWGLHHQWICKKLPDMTRLPASVTQLKVSKALLRLSTSNCNPQRRLVNFRFSARSLDFCSCVEWLCWNVLGWTVVAWIYDQMQRCQKKIITIQSISIDVIVIIESISCTEIASRKRNAFLFRYLLGRTLSIYTGVPFLSQCLVPLKITDFGNLLDMYKAFCWTHGVWGLAVNVGNVRIQVTHVNLRTSLGITSQSRPVWTHKGYHQTDAGLIWDIRPCRNICMSNFI